MRKPTAVLGSLLFLLVAPGTVAVLVPWLISKFQFQPEALPLRVAGAVLIAAGLAFLLDSFARFALTGLGTPAPVAPPQHLVVTGWYRFVRNPMYVAVVAIIVGEALLLGNLALFAYAIIVWFGFHAFVAGFEEPALRRAFGDEYGSYCARVPRWIPRPRR
jgi:protein-S-isoprenylcysteine O-methyltransferase Ste14